MCWNITTITLMPMLYHCKAVLYRHWQRMYITWQMCGVFIWAVTRVDSLVSFQVVVSEVNLYKWHSLRPACRIQAGISLSSATTMFVNILLSIKAKSICIVLTTSGQLTCCRVVFVCAWFAFQCVCTSYVCYCHSWSVPSFTVFLYDIAGQHFLA